MKFQALVWHSLVEEREITLLLVENLKWNTGKAAMLKLFVHIKGGRLHSNVAAGFLAKSNPKTTRYSHDNQRNKR